MKLYDFFTVDIDDYEGEYFLWEDEPLEPLLFSLYSFQDVFCGPDCIHTLYPNGDYLLAIL